MRESLRTEEIMSHSKIVLRLVVTVLVGIGVAAYVVVGPNVSNVSAQGGCSGASFSGSYGLLVHSVNLSGTSRIATLGVTRPDGAGNISGEFTTSPPVNTGTFTGAYVINADCSGSMNVTNSFGESSSWVLILTDAGANVQFLRTSGAEVATGIARKQ
jgi:hypothetical protein